jgi:hypothetical protein
MMKFKQPAQKLLLAPPDVCKWTVVRWSKEIVYWLQTISMFWLSSDRWTNPVDAEYKMTDKEDRNMTFKGREIRLGTETEILPAQNTTMHRLHSNDQFRVYPDYVTRMRNYIWSRCKHMGFSWPLLGLHISICIS